MAYSHNLSPSQKKERKGREKKKVPQILKPNPKMETPKRQPPGEEHKCHDRKGRRTKQRPKWKTVAKPDT